MSRTYRTGKNARIAMDNWVQRVSEDLAKSIRDEAIKLNPVKTGRSKRNWWTKREGSNVIVYNNTPYQSKIEFLGWTYTPPYRNLYRAIHHALGK